MRILLGITGGIAAYKAPMLVRALQKQDHTVRCVVTANGLRMVTVDALAAISQHPVVTSDWPGDGGIPHIDLARWCEGILIAPATANSLAKIVIGLADDLLSTTVLAVEPDKRRWIAPAMNTVMYQQPAVQRNVATLRADGWRIIDPVPGNLACGEVGTGAMADPTNIAHLISATLDDD